VTLEDNISHGFEEFGLRKDILKGVHEAGFRAPSPVQLQSIPQVMKGRDVIARAQTGTGKTAAFGLPAMNFAVGSSGVVVLIITPTRELASQVSNELYRLGRYASIKTVAVYGGQSIGRQVEQVSRGAQVVTATPGRLLDHLRSNRFRKFSPSIVILDEADEMLDMGFLEDIEAIFDYLPKERQTLLFSATLPPAIRKLAEKILKSPVSIDVTPKQLATPTDIVHRYYVIEEKEREEALVRLIDTEAPKKSLIFCRTRKETDVLSTTLISRGYVAKALHGDMEQPQRNEAIESFKQGRIDLLIATDVAARGLDIIDVTHVFNYHIPFNPESYIHRIGRTGRAGKKGIAISLVTPLEFKELSRIKKISGAPILYKEIPTIGEAKKYVIEELFGKLEQQHIHEEAVELLQHLSQDMDVTQVACKAFSMLLDQRQIEGPNRIGLSSGRVERIMENLRKQRSTKGKQYGHYRGRQHRNRQGQRRR
jgi:ATP-dependent RNA helicase DeaD